MVVGINIWANMSAKLATTYATPTTKIKVDSLRKRRPRLENDLTMVLSGIKPEADHIAISRDDPGRSLLLPLLHRFGRAAIRPAVRL